MIDMQVLSGTSETDVVCSRVLCEASSSTQHNVDRLSVTFSLYLYESVTFSLYMYESVTFSLYLYESVTFSLYLYDVRVVVNDSDVEVYIHTQAICNIVSSETLVVYDLPKNLVQTGSDDLQSPIYYHTTIPVQSILHY